MRAENVGRGLARGPGFLLSRVGTSVQAGFKNVLAVWQLRPLHFLVLTALRESGVSSQQELCRSLGVDSGNMVDLIDWLEELPYVKRSRDRTDRRRYALTITEEGRAALDEIMSSVEEFDCKFLAALTAEEQRQLADLLAKLYAGTPEAHGEGFIGTTPPVTY